MEEIVNPNSARLIKYLSFLERAKKLVTAKTFPDEELKTFQDTPQNSKFQLMMAIT